MPDNPFTAGGGDYARFCPTYPEALGPVLAGLGAQAGRLDVGCGSGQLACRLAGHFDRVTASDASADQLAAARDCPGVSYVCELAERIGLGDGSVDLVVAAQAAHWFDLDAFHAEARRVAAKGAAILLVSYGVPVVEGPAGPAFSRFYWQDIHRFWPAARRHVERGYGDLDFPFEALAVPELEILRDWQARDVTGCIKMWSAVRTVLAARVAGAGAVVAEFADEIAGLWGDADVCHRVRWPVTVRAGRIG